MPTAGGASKWWESLERGEVNESEKKAVEELVQSEDISSVRILWRRNHITRVEANECNISGVLAHEALTLLDHCVGLSLYGNVICGGIDVTWFPKNLIYLNLSRNELTGPFPKIAHLRRLKFVHLEHNKFSGPLPPFGPELEVLTAQDNQLSGDLPMLSTCPKLHKLWLFDNFLLTGSLQQAIPPSLKSLSSLLFTHTQIQGPIPDHLVATNCDVQLLVLTPQQEIAYHKLLAADNDDKDTHVEEEAVDQVNSVEE
mmetsp:Transcript_13120/g.17558  ORF Transcript_13120/g.17558 Transcript_13120/m.17558 type:complete len:256 (-) Transcript_13120:322-1089(-)|eukprot:CAMPEP_0197293430 /NCGR_PEP_ID=MMETSP0890-20130614/28489_1 /TAXON_ID=44058 ORGANISM="Aureoumbra lagunensis, Strain CCMP1510" /NCGR_SAMPLE_ID=MMETSP0890 /ASSEMBLY_ACC=CAM_ASM_000533 /LENGTH=255 /DNA_ID=CAMNT_0042768167 /DNA_START=182 /DNA_END=949 /DNA_ORIENTATION=+